MCLWHTSRKNSVSSSWYILHLDSFYCTATTVWWLITLGVMCGPPPRGYSELGKTPVATVSYPAFHQPPGCQKAFQHSGGSQAWHQRHQGTLRQLPDQCQFGSDLVWCFPETGKGQTSPFHLVKINIVHIWVYQLVYLWYLRGNIWPYQSWARLQYAK